MTNDLNSEETGMSTPQTSVMMMMASFRVDREVWARFGAIAKRERLTATDVLTDYIQRCADNDKTEYAVITGIDTSASTDTYDTDRFNEAVRMAVSTLSLCSHDDVSIRIDNAIDIRILPLVDPLADRLAKLEAQIEAIREDIKALPERAVVPASDSINSRTWAQFFQMVEMTVIPASKAQKKENITLRDDQAKNGILKAEQMGLGDWAVLAAGRTFVKVEVTALPLLSTEVPR